MLQDEQEKREARTPIGALCCPLTGGGDSRVGAPQRPLAERRDPAGLAGAHRAGTGRAMREERTVPLEGLEWRTRGGALTVRGHAAVFNQLSHDLGGFREQIAPGAFTKVLGRNPDVHALWDHDTSLVLARTKNGTLELREDSVGLHFVANVADTSYARDLKLLMERGDVDQASFAFTVAYDEWTVDEQENVVRTILELDNFYDVTVTAKGAYPQTDTAVVFAA